MKKTFTVAVCLGLVATLLGPAAAIAGGGFRGGHAGGRFSGGHGGFRGGFASRPFAHRQFVHRPFVHRHIVPFGVFAAPVIVFSTPALTYASPSYAYDPPPTRAISVVPTPPPPVSPTVIEYPTGRYELRGDGVATPYSWVWIPNAPPPPPPPAPPEGPPAGTPSSSATPPARRSEIYRWTDDDGVVHLTDRWGAVPQRYRKQATRTEPS